MVTIQVLVSGRIPGFQSKEIGEIIRVPSVIGLAAVIAGFAERID